MAGIKIVKPIYESAVSVNVAILGNVSSNRSIIVEPDPDCELEINSDNSIVHDIRYRYVMPESVSNNVTVDLSLVPVNHVCEFINKSTSYSIILNGPIINDSTDLLELKYNDYVRLKHIGNGVWTILDENFKNKIKYIEPRLGVLNIINARYLRTVIDSEVVFVLPTVESSFTEIHLFVKVGSDGGIIYPEGIKWTNEEPDLDTEALHEFIFTKVNDAWLIGCVTYV